MKKYILKSFLFIIVFITQEQKILIAQIDSVFLKEITGEYIKFYKDGLIEFKVFNASGFGGNYFVGHGKYKCKDGELVIHTNKYPYHPSTYYTISDATSWDSSFFICTIKVVDKTTSLPIPGVTIGLQNCRKQKYVYTNKNGTALILNKKCKKDTIINISYVGYQEVSIFISAKSKSKILVNLEEGTTYCVENKKINIEYLAVGNKLVDIKIRFP